MTVYPRCNSCGELVHPIFDWCDLGQEYLCGDCHTDAPDEDDNDQPCSVCLEPGCTGGCID
ncbi:hypothetical protein SEA_LINETTI_96 [Gordonia phage Linetti]|nr:hypothetical protein SEA_LINETTI_96 [Gordonia phage Linetti]